MADIFLSYASHDLKTILPLARALEQEGWSVFWDREIPLGKTWRQVLDAELAAARCIVVVWTKTSVDRRWVLEEAEEAQNRGILIPVFMDRVEPPRGFKEIQGASLLDWKGKSDDKEFVRLCGACRDIIGAPGSPPPPRQPEPEISKPKKSQLRRVARFKWMAVALGLVLVTGGYWFWYQTPKRQADPANVPVNEPVPEVDSLAAALRYREACNGGSAQDCVNLGALYEEGRGVAKDQLRAAGLYQQACDGGVAAGCERLKLLDERRPGQAKEPTRTTTEAQASDPSGPTSESKAEKRAQLRITVSPWGDVWINGDYGHRAPWNLSLKPGTYTISVGRGTPAETRVIRLKPGQQRTEHFDLSD